MERCFMFGHRDTDEQIYPMILEAAERCVREYGVGEFIVGHYGAFDRLAKRAITEIKKEYPVRLTLILSFHPSPADDFSGFDGTLYPFDVYVPPKAAIVRANQRCVDLCGCIITYARFPGHSRDLLEYAQKRGKFIIQV